MRIKLTLRARRRIQLVEAWWRENRPGAPDLFREELAWARQKLLSTPHLAPRYQMESGKVFRRLLLPATEQHVYYVVDDAADLIVVYTVWGARRGRTPNL